MTDQLNSPTSAIYTADNLPILRGLNSECIDLIYLDPPFNTGKQWHAPIGSDAKGASFNDIWGWDRATDETLTETIERQWAAEREYVGSAVREVVEAAVAAHSPQMGAYCAWMAPRLVEMHRVLAPTGSLYLHCDDTANSYLRLLLDAIFGANAIVSAIVWGRRAENLSRNKWRRAAESILHYAVDVPTWNQQFLPHDPEYVRKAYRSEDSHGRFTTTSCTNNAHRPNMIYEFNGITRQWRFSEQTMLAHESAGRLVIGSSGVPRLKKYLHETPGVSLSNMWSDIDVLSSNASERTGYPTQKPIALLERIIKASSNPGDIVLDPFCGCATACIAAQKLERHWIGIDVSATAVDLCRQRLQNELGMFDQTIALADPPARTDYLFEDPDRIQRGVNVRAALWEQLPNGECVGCGESPGVKYMEVDHVVPRSKGGEHKWSNVQLLCGPCNRSKGAKSMAQWMKEQS